MRTVVSLAVACLVVLSLYSFAACSSSANAQQVEKRTESPLPKAESATEVLLEKLDQRFGQWVVDPIAAVVFFDLWFWDNHRYQNQDRQLPLIVVWLMVGATFLTFRMGFISLRGFRHAIVVTSGKYHDANAPGEVSHFQALTSAMSATVGLGNIAGVAVAVTAGGPGAVFWMIVAGFLGMSSKFTECALAQIYRKVDDRGHILGGPMRYLQQGFADAGKPKFGAAMAKVFAVLCVGGSLGGGNMFQANQSYAQVAAVVPFFDGIPWLYGLILASVIGFVILGGIRRIGVVASYVVPFMCLFYLAAGSWILWVHADRIAWGFEQIFHQAFIPEAGYGGMLGVLVTGFRRAGFSNEAGTGSAPIAHSAACTNEPVREGFVGLLEPFIDTVVVCTMTALIIIVTGAHQSHPGEGVRMTAAAFQGTIEWFPKAFSVAVVLFAFSTMLSWCYYGERSWTFLFGTRYSTIYKLFYLSVIILGAVLNLKSVMDFSDLMILSMAFPNMAALYLLSTKVKRHLDEYWKRYRAGEFDAA